VAGGRRGHYIVFDSHKEAGIVSTFLPGKSSLLFFSIVLMCRVTSLVRNDTGVFLRPLGTSPVS